MLKVTLITEDVTDRKPSNSISRELYTTGDARYHDLYAVVKQLFIDNLDEIAPKLTTRDIADILRAVTNL